MGDDPEVSGISCSKNRSLPPHRWINRCTFIERALILSILTPMLEGRLQAGGRPGCTIAAR